MIKLLLLNALAAITVGVTLILAAGNADHRSMLVPTIRLWGENIAPGYLQRVQPPTTSTIDSYATA